MKSIPVILASLLFLAGSFLSVKAQPVYPQDDQLWFYRVWFSEKSHTVSNFSPEELLSPAAISRREKLGIPLLTERDIPVSRQHMITLSHYGFKPRCTSKWLNTALFTTTEAKDQDVWKEYYFIDSIQLVRRPADPVKRSYSKYGITAPGAGPDAYDPRIPLNGNLLHKSGFTGRKITIAVLDDGFAGADATESLEPLRQRGGIIATRNFVNSNDHVYDYDTHGTSVLSILAGSLQGIINGTAPGADYLLLRTEDKETEYPVEEDYWVAAAEYADSAGADIITSSLGYLTFDDPAFDYSFNDMDGNIPFITRGADIAASKGILVVNSAGNERTREWLRIIAPSDGDSVLCIGALRQDLTVADFSSAGYSADGRVKPDLVAPGVGIPIQYEPGLWSSGSGTSFSCPVISGLCASLMQAMPAATPAEIIDVLHRSSDRFNQPDSLYGYGIPDFIVALRLLKETHDNKSEADLTAGPNPFTDQIMLWFNEPPEYLSVTLTSAGGVIMAEKNFPVYVARSFRLDGLGHLAQGLYVVKVITAQGERMFRMIRVSR